MPLQFGDALLVYGQRRNLEAVARDPDFLVLDEAAARAPRLEKAHIAAAIMLAVLLSAILGPRSHRHRRAHRGGADGARRMPEHGRSLSRHRVEGRVPHRRHAAPGGWPSKTRGRPQMGAGALVAAVGDLGPRWVVAALFVVTVIGTQVIPTAALVVLMAPVALSAADTLGISPHLLMMTVAISASSSFASPLSHPAHLLVMGPGGYRFIDYVKVGVAHYDYLPSRVGGAVAHPVATLRLDGQATPRNPTDFNVQSCAPAVDPEACHPRILTAQRDCPYVLPARADVIDKCSNSIQA